MEVKIWSDVRCPFCYIGKKRFETALEQFPNRDQVEVVWKSFQLDPSLRTDPQANTLDYFVRTKGVSPAQARQMFAGATEMAREEGLNFDLENAIPANSFDAHRLIQLAKTKNLGNEIEEALFRAHFEEGKNIDDPEILAAVAREAGIADQEVRFVLNSEAFAAEVRQDELEARKTGVRGVPFFVFEDRYAISGAQPSEAFLETLEKAWAEHQKQHPSLEISGGDSCAVDGSCD